MDLKQELEEFNQSIEEIDPDFFNFHILRFDAPSTDEQLGLLQERCNISIPEDLKDFYLQYGGLERNEKYSECYLEIPGVSKVLKLLNSIGELASLGLIDGIKHSWGNDRWEFEEDEFFSSAELQSLNDKYKFFGLYRPDLERAHYLYFDQQGNFGELFYDQDLFDDAETELRSMLLKSPASLDFHSLLKNGLQALLEFRRDAAE
ncbi:SMI1/KNR4 family protein [Ottowia thiooxydans]|uniref:SMI1/KNR4 family protein n=1 Tax=Ottowia thiooxydans TaxID=219182 RepID=UPI00042963C1|nr:SMI1/KNR4 family protein [Ottowia thiooxydans]